MSEHRVVRSCNVRARSYIGAAPKQAATQSRWTAINSYYPTLSQRLEMKMPLLQLLPPPAAASIISTVVYL
uniref:Uncharacterized protein n=1 Tax=Arundo donax TaxID=35708 RepID=A0A0A9G9H8_ARUDO